MTVTIPACPSTLKNIQAYLKTASDHDDRDPVVSYWCRLYSLQTGLQYDKTSKDGKMFLMSLMDWLEENKLANSTNEAFTNEMAAQAYIENYALKLFNWADSMDRASNFNKNVVKAFYTAGILMDVLTTLGELSEEILQSRKYTKWKAAYINNCLKTGETPIPGPAAEGKLEDEDDELNDLFNTDKPKNIAPPPTPPPSATFPPPNGTNFGFINPPSPTFLNIPDSSKLYNPHPTPTDTSPDIVPSVAYQETGNIKVNPVQITKAQKYCKFASSALNYDDVPEAIANLQKALTLLQTGKDA